LRSADGSIEIALRKRAVIDIVPLSFASDTPAMLWLFLAVWIVIVPTLNVALGRPLFPDPCFGHGALLVVFVPVKRK
jgi:hypothetical protein